MTAALLRRLFAACIVSLASPVSSAADAAPTPLRIATFNTSLNDPEGRLVERLRGDDGQARRIAAVIQRVRPQVILLNEFDYDAEGVAAELFQRRYLEVGQFGEAPITYTHRFTAEVNTGVPSGLDVNGDGKVEGPSDAWGFGLHPGQFGMLVLSQFPLDAEALRSFRLLRWSSLPGARRPLHPESGQPLHDEMTWQALRLSSKAHWDLPVATPLGRLHLLLAHPTPPVFDGPENLNGRRNFDELRLWAEYLGEGEAAWLRDDQGGVGRLGDGAFVILGDLNADPVDGDSMPGAIDQLLTHPRVARFPAPRSAGAEAASRLTDNHAAQRGDPATDTASFSARSGNMRVDYVIPSRELAVVDGGVFWPREGEVGADWIGVSDHRLVWLDLVPASTAAAAASPTP
jgi:hypothetical protein